jgi:hypothetical protein
MGVNRKWRQANPERFNEHKKNNYAQTRKNAHNSSLPWSKNEEAAITAEARPSDRELSKKLGRSVQAIQIHRSRMKN